MRLNKITLRNRKQVVLEYDTTTVPTTAAIEKMPSKSEENVWYRNPGIKKSLIYYTKKGSYGFNNNGIWTDSYALDRGSLSRCTIATYEDIKDMLLKECKKRFSEDERFRCLEDRNAFRFGRSATASYSIESDYLYIGFGKIYEKGKWASTYQ